MSTEIHGTHTIIKFYILKEVYTVQIQIYNLGEQKNPYNASVHGYATNISILNTKVTECVCVHVCRKPIPRVVFLFREAFY